MPRNGSQNGAAESPASSQIHSAPGSALTQYDIWPHSLSCEIEEGNFKAAIRIICSEDAPAPDSLETLKTLQEKHQKAPSVRRTSCDPSSSARRAALQVSSAEVGASMKSFPLGSSGDSDNVSPQHIRDLLSDPELLEKFTDLANLLLSGGLPQPVREIIYGGRLIVLRRKMAASDPSLIATCGDG